MMRMMVTLFIVLLTALSGMGALQAQPTGPGMMHGGAGPGEGYGMQPQPQGVMGGMMRQGGMMPGMAHGPMCMGAGMGGMHQIMASFHAWIGRLMASRQALSLSPEQVQQLEEDIAAHHKTAIRNRAEARILMVDLRQAFRAEVVDAKAVKSILRKVADLDFELQVGGADLCVRVLKMLTKQQREMVSEMIGTPFSAPWEQMTMGLGMGMPRGAPPGTVPPSVSPRAEEKKQ